MDIKSKRVVGIFLFLFLCLALISLQIFNNNSLSHKYPTKILSRNVFALAKKTRINNKNTLKDLEDRKALKQCFRLSIKTQSLQELQKMTVSLDIGNTRNQTMIIRKSTDLLKRNLTVASSCKRFVTFPEFMGRMGNQMFETASVIGLAYRYDAIPVIPSWLPLRKYFDIPNAIDIKENQLVNIVDCHAKKAAVFYNCSKEFLSQANISVHGYRQSWKYFSDIGDLIKNVFKLKSRHILNANRFLSNVSLQGYQRVCIHVRRGDFNEVSLRRRGFLTADRDYIERAKRIFINKYKRVQFIVVSDDKEWCRKNLKDVIISSLTDPGDEMALMTLSDHVIVTVGTFGWWGAWLSGGTVVYLKAFAEPGSIFASEFNIEDYFPSSWIGIR